MGCRVALLEAAPQIGGTGVHSPVDLVCTWFDKSGRFINRGLYEEILPYLYNPESLKKSVIQTYDEAELKETYLRLLGRENNLKVLTSSPVLEVEVRDGRISAVKTGTGAWFEAAVFIDSTADGNLSAAAGADFEQRRASDGKPQPGTLTFRVEGVDFTAFGLDPERPDWARWDNFHVVNQALEPCFEKLWRNGGTSNPRRSIFFRTGREPVCCSTRPGLRTWIRQIRFPSKPPWRKAGNRLVNFGKRCAGLLIRY